MDPQVHKLVTACPIGPICLIGPISKDFFVRNGGGNKKALGVSAESLGICWKCLCAIIC